MKKNRKLGRRLRREARFDFQNWIYEPMNAAKTVFSVQCLSPSIDDDGTNYTDHPTDFAVSKWIGKKVRFADAGDANDYPETIYHSTGG